MEENEDTEEDTQESPESSSDEAEYREISDPGSEEPTAEAGAGEEDVSVSERSSEADRIESLEEELREREEEISRLRDEVEEKLEEHERRLDELSGEVPEDAERRRSRSLGPVVPSERPAKAAGFILGVTGFLGLVAAFVAAVVTLSPGITSPFIDALGREAAVATAGLSVILSAVVVIGGWWSYGARRWYPTVFAALVASVFVTPLGLPALILIVIAEPVFE